MTERQVRTFDADDYRLLTGILRDWLSEGFSSDDLELAAARDLLDRIETLLSEYDYTPHTP